MYYPEHSERRLIVPERQSGASERRSECSERYSGASDYHPVYPE